MKAKYRQAIYLVALAASFALAVVVVGGWVTQEQVFSVFDLAVSIFGAIGAILALANLTPDP